MNTLTTTQDPITSANAKGTAMHAGTRKNNVIGILGAAKLTHRLGLLGLVAVLGLAGNVLAASATRSSSFDYDPVSGLLIKEVVEPGDSNLCLVTTYTYDSFGNKTGATTRNCNGSATSISGGTVEAAAPAAGSAALFAARTSTTTYSNDGRFPVISANALSQSETKVFDTRFGAVTKLTGPNGLATEWAYDGFGRKTLEKRADGNGTKWTYEYCGSVTVNGASGTATCPTIAGAVGAFVITNTPVAGPIDIAAGTTGAQNGPIIKVYFDTLSREIRTETQGYDGGSTASQAVYKDTEYDALGRINRSSQPYYAGAAPVWTDFDYDVLGRQVSQSAPDDNNQPATTTVSYNGLTVSVTNAKGQITTKTSNVVGQVVTVTDAYNKTLTQSYDPFGNLVQTTDVLGNTTTLTYDARGRKTQMKDPDMGTWSYAYNALGELTKQTNARSEVTTLAYDLLGRMLTRTEVGLTSTWSYDKYADGSACAKGVGKLCDVATSGGYKRKQVYDSLGRPSSTTETVGSAYTYGSTYDANGRVATVSYPSGLVTTKNVYTALGYLKEVRNADTTNALYWRADVIDAQGRVTRQTYGNNVVTLNTFSSTTGRLLSSSAGVNLANNAVQSIAYAYDSLGNLSSRNDGNSGVSANYGYDNLNRLTAETRSGGALTTTQTSSFTYDPIGNLKTRTEAGVTLTYTYPASGATSVRPHAVSSIAGTVNNVANPGYTYDAAGNMVSATGRGDLLWASFDKLSRVTRIIGANTSQLDYTYDADHDRVKEVYNLAGVFKRSTVYLNPAGGAGLFYEEETGPAVSWGTRKKHYINAGTGTVGVLTWVGGGNPAPWEMRYWHKDHLGSVMAVSKEDGSVTERMAYEPFGKRRNSNGTTDAAGTLTTATDRGYTGHEMMDDVGLINMNGRVYDPAISRFMSADPYIQSPSDLQSYNRYTYGFNSPTGGADPSGYCFLGCFWQPKKALNILKKFDPVANYTSNMMRFNQGVVNGNLGMALTGLTWAHTGPAGYYTDSYIQKNPSLAPVAQAAGTIVCGVFTWGIGIPACVAGVAAYSSAVMGGSNGDILRAGAVTFATTYAFSYVDGANWGTGTTIVAKSVVGGIGAELQGGSFKDGFMYSALSATASELYKATVKYRIDPRPGGDAVTKGEFTSPVEGANNIGFQGDTVVDGLPKDASCGFCEGGTYSRMLNRVPGINAVAGLHDYFQINLGAMRNILNVPGMPLAAAITYAGLLDGTASVQFATHRRQQDQ